MLATTDIISDITAVKRLPKPNIKHRLPVSTPFMSSAKPNLPTNPHTDTP